MTLAVSLLLVASASAVPFHSPTIDGTISGNGVDWDAADLVAADPLTDDDLTGSHNVRRLWCTWDQDNLYLGVTYQDFGSVDSLSVFVDLDRGVGPNSAAELTAMAGNYRMPDGGRVELVLGRAAVEAFPGAAPSAVLVTDAEGNTEDISELVVAQAFNTGTKASLRFPFWLNAEFAVPWSALYPDLDGGVPPLAAIRAVAAVAGPAISDPSLQRVDTVPSNDGLFAADEMVVLDEFHVSIVDADGDGAPDPADGAITSTVILPGDPGGPVTISAEMIDFAGRELGAPLSSTVTADGVRDWMLQRLPAGRYSVTIEAEGYIAASVEIDVDAGEHVILPTQTLAMATIVQGDIRFDSGPGGAGTVVLAYNGQWETDRSEFDFGAEGGTFLLYTQYTGNYTVTVEVPTYRPTSISIPVTAGENVTGLEIVLEREFEINGGVSFESGPGGAGTVRFLDAGGVELDAQDFAFTGGVFEFYTPAQGEYTLSATAGTYIDTDTTFTITGDVAAMTVDLVLPRQAEITGSVAFEGPASAGLLTLYDATSGAVHDTLDFAEAGDPVAFFLMPGEYRIGMAAPGYLPLDLSFTVGREPIDLGQLQLTAVRATRLLLIDDQEQEIDEVRGTKSTPADDLWFLTRIDMLAVDDDGNLDLFDLDGALTDFRLSALKMDDVSIPGGSQGYYASADRGDVLTTLDFTSGRASFWMTSDRVEVLRVYLAQPEKDPIAGRIIVAFLDPQPKVVVLTAAAGDTLTANGIDALQIKASLFDAARNPSAIDNIPVTFIVGENSGGAGQFETATVTTNADGEAVAELTAHGAGLLDITCSVTYASETLDVLGYDLDSGEETLKIVAISGPAAGWDLLLPGTLSSFSSPVDVTAQVVDEYGNAVAEEGRTVIFAADPPEMGVFDPASALSDTNGRAVSTFVPAGAAGLVSFQASGDGFAADAADMQLGDLFVVSDPAWYDEPEDHQTWAETDLTAVVIDNTADELQLDIPFKPGIGGMHLHVLFETNWDAEGGAVNSWGLPVNYGHAHLPDFSLVAKLYDDEWAEFRGWDASWNNWWNPELADGGDFQGSSASVGGVFVTRNGENLSVAIPWTPFDKLAGRPDSVRVEVFVTQRDGDTDRSAFDSVPSDATTNLDFDLYDPEDGDWDIAEETVTLQAWSDAYAVKTDFRTPPEVTDAAADPVEVTAGEPVILTALVTDAGDGVGDVLADLSAMGGGALTRMYDDGEASHGDALAGDGVWSLTTLVPLDNPGGAQSLVVNAYDGTNTAFATASAEIEVTAILEPILYVEDAIGDDHGPNQPGVKGKFYTYPTNLAFVEGAFDIESLTVFETRQTIGGEQVEMIAFQVKIGDFPDPADEGTADWNPNYADLNVTKIDIVIDSAPGGATASLPNRLAMFQSWDAWDYAIVMDGWFKALVPSYGQNTTDSWRSNAMTTDRDIMLMSDPELDIVTALVSREALGNPTAEEIRSWDMVVCMGSHDFGGEEVLGGIRWVNANRGEWQFGGGYEDDSKNIDANLMDLLLIPGTGHDPGRPQEEILDYDTDEALDREDAGLTSVAIEMSAFVDTGPPVIDTGAGESVVTRIEPVLGAPLALALEIKDDFRVDEAVFRYRSTGFAGEGWDRELPMGALGNDLWVVDIMPSWLDSNLVYSPVDSNRYLEFEVSAVDGSPEAKESISPVTTLQIAPDADCRPRRTNMESGDIELLQTDGSQITVSDKLRYDLLALHLAEAWSGPEAGADTMGAAVELVWDVCQAPAAAADAQSIPPARPLDIFRDIYLATGDTLGGLLDHSGRLPRPFEISLHYPQDWVPNGADENKIAMYRYSPASDRWVLVGGHASPKGNSVTASVQETGTFGLFHVESLNYEMGEVISGITISPNPFSPNGDGLYDEATISFFLDRTANVTVQIYNIEGIRKKVLQETFEYGGDEGDMGVPRRVPGLVWDGTNQIGESVPYGIYILRITATSGPDANKRTVRSNHSLAVIK